MFKFDGFKNPTTTDTTDSFVITSFDDEGYEIEFLNNGLEVGANAGTLYNV